MLGINYTNGFAVNVNAWVIKQKLKGFGVISACGVKQWRPVDYNNRIPQIMYKFQYDQRVEM